MGEGSMIESSSRPSAPRETSLQDIGLRRRPKALLLGELVLAGLFLVLTWWLIAGLLVDGFLADPGSVPPFIVDARLDGLRALLTFGLPLVLVAITWYRLRRDDRVAWPWTWLIVAWVGLAFSMAVIASADVTAAMLAGGLIPAVSIGTNQGYLRRVAGRSHLEQPWSPLRRAVILVVAIAIAIWILVYATIGVGSIAELFKPIREYFPRGFGW